MRRRDQAAAGQSALVIASPRGLCCINRSPGATTPAASSSGLLQAADDSAGHRPHDHCQAPCLARSSLAAVQVKAVHAICRMMHPMQLRSFASSSRTCGGACADACGLSVSLRQRPDGAVDGSRRACPSGFRGCSGGSGRQRRRPRPRRWPGRPRVVAAPARSCFPCRAPQQPVAMFLAQIGDVSASRLEDPESEQPELGHQGKVGPTRRLASGGQHGLELQLRETQRRRLRRHGRAADVLSRRTAARRGYPEPPCILGARGLRCR
jgi:hypothetical protein